MEHEEMLKIYRKSFTGTIRSCDLILISKMADQRFYKCPCGLNDHYASRAIDSGSMVGDGFSDVLHCINGSKWMILIINNAARVSGIIRKEEEKYFRLLDQADKKIKQYMLRKKIDEITADDLFILHTAYGYDPSVVEGVVGDIPQTLHDEYLLLMEEHKNVSKMCKTD